MTVRRPSRCGFFLVLPFMRLYALAQAPKEEGGARDKKTDQAPQPAPFWHN